MRIIGWIVLACVSCGAAVCADQTGKNQSTSAFPAAIVGETQKLEFHVSTPSNSGSLEVQTRSVLEELLRKSSGGTILKLRIFAVGEADLATIKNIVGDTFAKRKLKIPALSMLGVVGFPEPGQHLQMESTVQGKSVVNPNGLFFLAGAAAPAGEQAIGGLARVAREAGIAMSDVLRVSCFYESQEQVAGARKSIAENFPSAEASFVFSYSEDPKPAAECEGVARVNSTVAEPVRYFNLAGGAPSPNFSRGAFVTAPRIVLTGTLMALGASKPDLRDVFDRAKTAVEQLGAKLSDVVMADNYWLTAPARDQLREVRPLYFGPSVPAATGVFFAGLSDAHGTVAIELVVAITDSVTLSVGEPIVDGTRIYKPHLATLVQSLTRDGAVVRTNKYSLDKFAEQRNGVAVFRLELDTLPGEPDPKLHQETVLNLRTLALVHREERDGNGKALVADVDGAHVTGHAQSAADTEPAPFDFTLDVPSYFFPFLDAAVNATPLREGETFRIPAFDFAAKKTEWHTFRVSGRDTVDIEGRKVNAWIIEENSQSRYKLRKIWLIKEPPYFPLDVVYYTDGSILRSEQMLEREHP